MPAKPVITSSVIIELIAVRVGVRRADHYLCAREEGLLNGQAEAKAMQPGR